MWALGLSTVRFSRFFYIYLFTYFIQLEIATGQHPFAKMNALAIMSAIMVWIPEPPTNLSTELQQLIVWL
jgi:hypothetical protein